MARRNFPTKAVYICADQPATFTFRLRRGGGPYIYSALDNSRRSQLALILYHLISTRQQDQEATLAEMNEVARKREFVQFAKQSANVGYQLAAVGSVP